MSLWLQKLPDGLEPELGSGEEVLLALASDMDARMDYGASWLLATRERVLVYGLEKGRWKLLRQLELKGLKEVNPLPEVGGGVLLARTKERAVELIRYSNSMNEAFSGASKALRQLIEGRELLLPEEPKPQRCATCGRLKPNRQERCPFCVNYFGAMRRILEFFGPHKKETVAVVLLSMLATSLQLIPPLLQKILVDDVFGGGRAELLLPLVLAYLAVNVSHTFVEVFNGRKLAWLGGRLGTDIRLKVFQAVEKLSLTFFERRSVGQVMSRVMNDSGQLQQFLIDGFPYLANNALTLVGVVAILCFYSPKLTLLIMLPVPVMFLAQRFFWKLIRSLDHKSWNHQAMLNSKLNEQLSGVKVIKAFTQEEKEIRTFERQNERFFSADLASSRFWKVFFPGMFFFITSGILIVWWTGGGMVLDKRLSTGELLAFISYLWMFYGPLQWFQQVSNWMTRAFVGAERIFEVMDSLPEAHESKDAKPMPRFKGEIEFRNVSFSYERGTLALKDVSFKVKAGELIGLVGQSGSGKSTMLGLLLRFYEPDEGEILIDGVPLKEIRLEDLRKNLGLVLQEPFLFSTSIYDNICYGRPGSSMAAAMQAARAANAHDFIMSKPDAYDTRVGERGNRLSGGEKQRLSIARAILHDPRVLIMDEATSSVDSETEFKIQQAMDRLARARTTLVAAHRLSTLRHADRIFVMEKGRLVEQGSHARLMARRGRYHRMVRIQEKMWRRAKRNLAIAADQA